MINKDEIRIFLLKIIKYDGDVTPLVKHGLSYIDIVEMINNEKKEGNVVVLNGILGLTSKGDKILTILTSERKKGSNTWIEPEFSSRISKIEIDDIYLPSRREFSF